MELSLNASLADILIFLHILAGAAGLLGGIGALLATKGKYWHRSSGKVFFYGMVSAAGLALVISLMPGHVSPFLFSIGLFTLYLVLSGYRALRFRRLRNPESLRLDRFLSGGMVIIGIGMLGWAGWQGFGMGSSIVLAVFGLIGLALALRDLQAFRQPEHLRRNYLRIHLTKMLSGLIAATTAFMVTNEFLPGLWGWLSPTVLGTLIIVYWRRKWSRDPRFGPGGEAAREE